MIDIDFIKKEKYLSGIIDALKLLVRKCIFSISNILSWKNLSFSFRSGSFWRKYVFLGLSVYRKPRKSWSHVKMTPLWYFSVRTSDLTFFLIHVFRGSIPRTFSYNIFSNFKKRITYISQSNFVPEFPTNHSNYSKIFFNFTSQSKLMYAWLYFVVDQRTSLFLSLFPCS